MGVDEPRGSLHSGMGPLAAWTPRGDDDVAEAMVSERTRWARLWSITNHGFLLINTTVSAHPFVQQNRSDMGGTRCFTPCRPVPLLPMDVAAHSLPEPVRCDGPSHKAARTLSSRGVYQTSTSTCGQRRSAGDCRLCASRITHHVHSTVCKAGGALYGCATEHRAQSRRLSESISRGASHFVEGGCAVVGGQTACGGGVVAPRPPPSPTRYHPLTLRPTPPLPWPSIRHLPLLPFELSYSTGGATLAVAIGDPWLNRSVNRCDGATVLNAAY